MNFLKGKKLFVSGGAGFIGSSLATRVADHCQLVIFDTFQRDSFSDSPVAKHPNITVVKGDVRDFEGLKKAMQGCQMVVHMAGIAGIDTVIRDPARTMHTNMTGTANMLEAARQIGNCERFINFSTSEVFGRYTFKARESDWSSTGAVGEARWTYAVSKLAGEHLTYAYHHQYQMPTVTVRPFNVYGPAQVGEGAIHVFVTRAINDQPLEIHNDGQQIRAWTYIDDMVDGVVTCLGNPKAVGQSFNIGNPRGTITIFFLAEMIKRLAKSKSNIVHVKRNFTDVDLRIPNIDKAVDLLGFTPKIDLEEGLVRTIAWYRSHQK